MEVHYHTDAGRPATAMPGQIIPAGSYLRNGEITVDDDVRVAVVPDPWAGADSGRTVVHFIPVNDPARELTDAEEAEAGRIARAIRQGSCLDPMGAAQDSAPPVSGWIIARAAKQIVADKQAAERAEKIAEAENRIRAISPDCPAAISTAWAAVVRDDIDHTGWTDPVTWVKRVAPQAGWTDDQRQSVAGWLGSDAPEMARADWTPIDRGDPQDDHVGWGIGDD